MPLAHLQADGFFSILSKIVVIFNKKQKFSKEMFEHIDEMARM
jgi:hypothetical protein